ncbi:unnamed protein product [Bursaphelenchus okinawaensis]|uniref:Uncharacterized protein n=1 Tax=Bursaphelenchus okinawaensis TaxID=465554 RepID=A0A811LID6_9BILA|nr:unnamed protein product [Bursaphelenchus okinawaensis]CAG9123928.1 unnamed protein product [Bursaphelenchus okinawaensis]
MGSALCKREKIVDEVAEIANKTIEKELKKDRIQERKTIKVLLLGSADSGKSTIAKQMRILHAHGFNESELINYRYMIFTNMVVIYHHLCRGCQALNVPVNEDEQDLYEKFLNKHLKILDFLDDDIIVSLAQMRNSQFTKEGLKHVEKFYMPDNSLYLFANAHRILDQNYHPTEIDIIHARASTTGVYEIGFQFRNFYIRLIDVGGQKTERRKWIHCFENVTAVLFVTALSCYDQFLEEEPTKNCLEDSVELFNCMYNNEYLRKCNFILFLNKTDILERKVEHSSFSKYFPNYSEKEKYEEVRDYIKELFTEAEVDDTRHIYLHFTNATDRGNIDFVFGAACDIILQNNLNKAGMN